MLGPLLHQLPDVGTNGFEGLIAVLLRELSGFNFALSKSGFQFGRDGETSRPTGGVIMFECKNYLEKTDHDQRDLRGGLTQAIDNEPLLDVWIFATSKSVSVQLLQDLRKAANERVDIICLDCLIDGSGQLDILCASYPKITLDHLKAAALPQTIVKAAEVALQKISKQQDCQGRLKSLHEQIMQPTHGWPIWRNAAAKRWNNLTADASNSRKAFGQVLAVASPDSSSVKRLAASQALDMWWKDWSIKPQLAVVIGAEGNGKSWFVAQWLTEKLTNLETDDFPPVIFVSSQHVSGEPELASLLEKNLESNYPSSDPNKNIWRLRIRKWRENTACRSAQPMAIVVFDGINEHHASKFWRRLLEDSRSSEWINNIAVICTSRDSHWQKYFESLEYLDPEIIEVGLYNDSELAEALANKELKVSDFNDDLLALLRKPRYLDLAVKYHARIASCGDFTVPRLIYEDWKDRYERKSLPIAATEFNSFLRNLAVEHTSGVQHFSKKMLTEQFPDQASLTETFEELSSSGVLTERADGKWHVSEPQLKLGLAILLCDLLAKEVKSSEIQEFIAQWILPHSGMEIQSAILEQAALYSLINKFDVDIAVELLYAWLISHNPPNTLEQPTENRIMAYMPENPKAYFSLCEKLWTFEENHDWGQEILVSGIIRWVVQSAAVSQTLQEHIGRWLSFIHSDGHPILRKANGESGGAEV